MLPNCRDESHFSKRYSLIWCFVTCTITLNSTLFRMLLSQAVTQQWERLTPRLKVFCFQKMAKKNNNAVLKKEKYSQTQLQHEEIWYFNIFDTFFLSRTEGGLTAVWSLVWFGWDSWGGMKTGGNISASSLLPLLCNSYEVELVSLGCYFPINAGPPWCRFTSDQGTSLEVQHVSLLCWISMLSSQTGHPDVQGLTLLLSLPC